MAGNYHYGLMKRDDMNFVYAAFFTDRDDIYVKFGRSWQPYRRIRDVAQGCPFVLSQAVFCKVGAGRSALSIERSVGQQLAGYRTRGEWFRFSPSDGAVFSATVQKSYARFTGEKLKWSVVDHKTMLSEMAAHANVFVRPKQAKAEAEAA